MKAAFWHKKWEINEIGFDQPKVNPLLEQHFDTLKLTAGSMIFVPLCGKSIDMVWLLQQGMQVVGVELSQDAIERFFDELDVQPEISQVDQFICYQAENLTIYVGDFFMLNASLLGGVVATYDRASLVALPEHMRKDYTQHLATITNKAPQILITFNYDQSLQTGPPFSISEDEVKQHYAQHYLLDLLANKPVKGGLKGGCDALEQLWHFQPLQST